MRPRVDDLREELVLSTRRHVISELMLEWDPDADTTITIPPLPEFFPEPSGMGKGKGGGGGGSCLATCGKSSKGGKGKGM